jgi:hypothetical protein
MRLRLRHATILTLLLSLGVLGYHVWRISKEEADLAALQASAAESSIGGEPAWHLPLSFGHPIYLWIYGNPITPSIPLPPASPTATEAATGMLRRGAATLLSTPAAPTTV